MKSDYKSAGVNIAEGEKFVDAIKPIVRKTFSGNVLSGIGNFGAFYRPEFAVYKDPVLVSSIDGVGTKLKIAAALNKYDTIGEDLVNHCVNDIAVCGAVPMFFLDYFATGKLINKNAVQVVKGLARGCKNNGCSLIGGETAEMPGVYAGDDFDLAGSITGIVDRKRILDSSNVKAGDVLIGIRSNGLHTNGFSLVRKIFGTGKNLGRKFGKLPLPLGKELLKVHRSYLKVIQKSISLFKVCSIAHITGGGIAGNTSRIIPKGLHAEVIWNAWKHGEIFNVIRSAGGVPEEDMRRTFNLGIGLVFIVRKNQSEQFMRFLIAQKERPSMIGSVQRI
ncbi:MAG: phosphoribosylformylglycinamidine cyclo-ligase [Ignavibacteria bacterium]|nr:phosphoribosylformylglycinamidine cyclo-ligase [Ignavibacteria bacterium]